MDEIELRPEWIELLQSLTTHEVEFIVIGAFALAFNGIPRYTVDLDLLYKPSLENAEKLLRALREFGNPVVGLTPTSMIEPHSTITFGRIPARVDLLNWISGSSWDDADSDKVRGLLGEFEVWYISRRAYVANKLASGRPKDFVDAETVREMYPEEGL